MTKTGQPLNYAAVCEVLHVAHNYVMQRPDTQERYQQNYKNRAKDLSIDIGSLEPDIRELYCSTIVEALGTQRDSLATAAAIIEDDVRTVQWHVRLADAANILVKPSDTTESRRPAGAAVTKVGFAQWMASSLADAMSGSPSENFTEDTGVAFEKLRNIATQPIIPPNDSLLSRFTMNMTNEHVRWMNRQLDQMKNDTMGATVCLHDALRPSRGIG